MQLASELYHFLGDPRFQKPLLWSSSILSGVSLCASTYKLMQKFSPVWFPKAYPKLSEKDKIEWNNSLQNEQRKQAISFMHAIVSTLAASYLWLLTSLFRDEASYDPVVFRCTIFSVFFIGVSNGYFITDLAMILKYYPNLGGPEFVAHHVISIISLFMAMISGHAHVYIYTVLLSEITTPSINIRWYLDAAGKKNTKQYLYNGIFMFLSWLVFRIALFGFLFSHMYFHYDQIQQLHVVGFYFTFLSCTSFAVMNLYWFSKITKGLIKTLKEKHS